MNVLAFFLSPLGRWLAIGLVVVAAFSGAYLKGHSDGASAVQAKWNAATQAAIAKAEKARADAESAIDREPAGGVRHDKYDRD